MRMAMSCLACGDLGRPTRRARLSSASVDSGMSEKSIPGELHMRSAVRIFLCRGLAGRRWREIRLVVWRRGTSGLCRLLDSAWDRG